jgi:hypothetical protein
MNLRSVIWVVLGVLSAAVASPPLNAQSVTPAPVAKAVVLSPDLAFGRFIALIRGHLLTGDELVSLRQWDAASPHLMFPTEEIYGIIRDQLAVYKVPQFDGALKALGRTVKAHNAEQYTKARKKLDEALVAADSGLKSKVANWPRFVVAVGTEVLKTAADEYDDAFAKGRIVHPIGYQTARGFILQADRMFEGVAGEFAADKSEALSEIRAGFSQLKQAFANVNAPKLATIDYAAVSSLVSKIEVAAGKLTDSAN